MARLNPPPHSIYTHEGAKAKRISPEAQLRRTVLSCLLWEDNFYENGISATARICSLVPKVPPQLVAELAKEARHEMNLRHVPLLLISELAKHASGTALVSLTLEKVISRPDELCEFLAIYWREGRCPLSAQVKKGLAAAFRKFNEYQLAKYNRKNAIKLKDVLFLCHAKPKNEAQADLWHRLINDQLKTPDTWEVALSSGANPKEAWTRLLRERKLGSLALLRNLRNMSDAGVNEELIKEALLQMNVEKILPFRFLSAVKHAPMFAQELRVATLKALKNHKKLPNETVLLIDVSGSMIASLSLKSTLSRLDASCGVAILLREICEKVRIFTFSERIVEVPNIRDFGLATAIINSQPRGGTLLGAAVKAIYNNRSFIPSSAYYQANNLSFPGFGLRPDRLIVITDEQSHDSVPDPIGRGYMINVAGYKNGIGYGPWVHIDGWSEAVVRFIQEFEESEKE